MWGYYFFDKISENLGLELNLLKIIDIQMCNLGNYINNDH